MDKQKIILGIKFVQCFKKQNIYLTKYHLDKVFNDYSIGVFNPKKIKEYIMYNQGLKTLKNEDNCVYKITAKEYLSLKSTKKVVAFKKGVRVRYDSTYQAAKILTGSSKNNGNIANAIKYRRNAYGYRWKYLN